MEAENHKPVRGVYLNYKLVGAGPGKPISLFSGSRSLSAGGLVKALIYSASSVVEILTAITSFSFPDSIDAIKILLFEYLRSSLHFSFTFKITCFHYYKNVGSVFITDLTVTTS